jgi:hypothetical protein
VQAFRGVGVLLNCIAERHQSGGCRANPIGQGGDIEFDALAGEEFALPVQWKMRAVFTGQNFREQLRASPSARNRMGGAGGCVIASQSRQVIFSRTY